MKLFMLTCFIYMIMCVIYYTFSRTSNLTGSSVHYNTRYIITSNMDIAIIIPTTTRNIKSPKLEKLSLMRLCLPSIVATIESVYNYIFCFLLLLYCVLTPPSSVCIYPVFILNKSSWFTKLISNFWLVFRYSLTFLQVGLNLIE
jgi:hypothetical protein